MGFIKSTFSGFSVGPDEAYFKPGTAIKTIHASEVLLND